MSHDAAGPKRSVKSVLAYRFTAIAFAACAVSFGFTQSWGVALPFLVLAFTFFILGEEKKKRITKVDKVDDDPKN